MNKIAIVILVTVFVFIGCRDTHLPVWQIKLQSRSYTDPIIEGKHFYVFSQAGEVICGDVKSGDRIWSRMVDGPVLGTPALSTNQTLFVVTQNGSLYSIDAKTGNSKWQIQIPDTFIAPVALLDAMVLLPSETGKLYARSTLDGEEKWSFTGATKFNTRAVSVTNHLLIGGWSKDFYCLKPSGSLSWKFTAAERITEDAIVSRNTVFFPTYDSFVYALDIPSGRLLWRFPAKLPSKLILWNEELLFASGDDLVSVSPLSGKLIRRRPFGKTIDRLYLYPQGCLVLSRNVFRVSPDLRETSIFIQAAAPIFKLGSGSGMVIASDDLFSIYGYAIPTQE